MFLKLVSDESGLLGLFKNYFSVSELHQYGYFVDRGKISHKKFFRLKMSFSLITSLLIQFGR